MGWQLRVKAALALGGRKPLISSMSSLGSNLNGDVLREVDGGLGFRKIDVPRRAITDKKSPLRRCFGVREEMDTKVEVHAIE